MRFPRSSEPPTPSGLWITRARMAEKGLPVCMNISTQATPRGPKHRARTPRWPRLTALAASASLIGLFTAGSLALQPASAVQDATTPADVNLTPDPPTCDNLACTWTLTPANDAYSFIIGRDSPVSGGILIVEAQSAEVIPGVINTWSARIVDPSRIVIVDFMDGTPRVWTNGGIALQASPSPLEPGTQLPSAIDWLKRLPQPFDPSVVGRVRIRQIYAPTLANRELVAPTDAQVAQLGNDISAIGHMTFSEPVTGLTASDLALSPMSEGCRVDSVSDLGDHLHFEFLIRGCTSMWMSLSLPPWSVLGHAPGPINELFLGPMQPRVIASVVSPPSPTATATPAPSATPPVEPTPTATPTPSATVVTEPAVQNPTQTPVAPTPDVPSEQPGVNDEAVPVADSESTPQSHSAPQAESAPASFESSRSDDQAGASVVAGDGGPGGGTPPNQLVAAEPIANGSPQQAPVATPEWLMPVAAGLAAVGGVTAGAVALQRVRGRLSGRVKLRLPRRHPVGVGAA